MGCIAEVAVGVDPVGSHSQEGQDGLAATSGPAAAAAVGLSAKQA